MTAAPIVVGISSSEASAEAVRWAVHESRRVDAPLVLVHAYRTAEGPRASRPLRTTYESLARSRATRWAQDALAGDPAVRWPVRLVVREEDPATALLSVSHDARLLVLGRDRAATGRHLLDRCRVEAACPVREVEPPHPGGTTGAATGSSRPTVQA